MSRDDFSRIGEGRSDSLAGHGDDRLEPNGGIATLEEVLKALTHPRRRAILYYLQDHRVATADELARQIVALELGVGPDEVPDEARERVLADLVHTHLPQLADSLCIEYDQMSQTAMFTDPPLLLDKILEVLAQIERELSY